MAGGTARSLTFVVAIALLLSAAPALAGSQDSPEISDEEGDLTSQYWIHGAATSELPESPSPSTLQAINTSADITKAWVHQENAERFMLTIEVRDLPDESNVSGPLVDISTYFTVLNEAYEARTSLSIPAETQQIQASYNLFKGDSQHADLAGSLDATGEQITLFIPKATLGNPGFGDTLTEFHVRSHLADSTFVLDYAPGTPTVDPATGNLVSPSLSPEELYGQAYEFGQFEGAVPASLQATATPSSLMLQAGQSAQVSIQLTNDAQTQDTANLAVMDRPSGWSVSAAQTSITLDPGQSRFATIDVRTPASASGQSLITVSVASDLGADIQLPISVQVTPSQDTSSDSGTSQTGDQSDGGGAQPASPAGDSSQAPTSQEPAPEQSAEESENGAPLPAMGAILAALAVAAVVARRER